MVGVVIKGKFTDKVAEIFCGSKKSPRHKKKILQIVGGGVISAI